MSCLTFSKELKRRLAVYETAPGRASRSSSVEVGAGAESDHEGFVPIPGAVVVSSSSSGNLVPKDSLGGGKFKAVKDFLFKPKKEKADSDVAKPKEPKSGSKKEEPPQLWSGSRRGRDPKKLDRWVFCRAFSGHTNGIPCLIFGFFAVMVIFIGVVEVTRPVQYHTLIGSASFDGTARLWAVDGSGRAVFDKHKGAVNSVRFSSNLLACSSGVDGTVQIWKVPAFLTESKTPREIDSFDNHHFMVDASSEEDRIEATASPSTTPRKESTSPERKASGFFLLFFALLLSISYPKQ